MNVEVVKLEKIIDKIIKIEEFQDDDVELIADEEEPKQKYKDI